MTCKHMRTQLGCITEKQISEHMIRTCFKNKPKHVCGKVCSAKITGSVDVFDLTLKLRIKSIYLQGR